MEFDDGYSQELEVAVKAVHMACLLCKRVQERLLSKSGDHVQSKDDNSLVTVAGNSLPPSLFSLLYFLEIGCYLLLALSFALYLFVCLFFN